MAPELISKKAYNSKVDIWSLGILLMECMEGDPPYYDEPLSRALMLICVKGIRIHWLTRGIPDLKQPEKWSQHLRAFLKLCLTREVALRPSARQLTNHDFLLNAATPQQMGAFVRQKKDQ